MEPAGIAEKQRWVLEAVDRHELGLLRFAARLSGDAEAARDAVQHAFLRLCGQSPERLRGREGPWLFAVCRNHIIDLLRKGGATMPCCDADPPDCEGREPDPAAAAEQADLSRSINRLVDQLPLSQREAVALWSEGFSYHDVARVTGASEGNVRVMVHRALKTLREALGVKSA